MSNALRWDSPTTGLNINSYFGTSAYASVSGVSIQCQIWNTLIPGTPRMTIMHKFVNLKQCIDSMAVSVLTQGPGGMSCPKVCWFDHHVACGGTFKRNTWYRHAWQTYVADTALLRQTYKPLLQSSAKQYLLVVEDSTPFSGAYRFMQS